MPGQYFDQESGLHYNYFRDYDPRTGRYIEPDPIGLAGGTNLYPYAENSPMNVVDPLGLFILSMKYSDNPYGSITIVWNKWLPHYYTSTTRGGADINLPGDIGNTPLHEAVGWGHEVLVKTLLELGASSYLKNKFGETPRNIAEIKSNSSIAEVLMKAEIAGVKSRK